MVLPMVATFLLPKEVVRLGIYSASTHINSVSRSDPQGEQCWYQRWLWFDFSTSLGGTLGR